ncbi:MAG: DUF2905 domain-containing protein [Pseudomonadota bacterium]
MAKMLIIAGLLLAAAGLGWLMLEKFQLGRLPGDIVVERERFQFYLPLATSIVLSAVLTLALWLLNR